ncbi:hypothetical protein CALCODRAFT_493168 [Calocera cornea HHB12733]|uniref:Mediator of RNA polymerase II transcription subunit 4 n=1 Tax=Calocera cornea HHB12733 TaxID=1353952 RepID=A0A165HY37_9BASI|nr:hypothetical protein CALCODRAFT_493168 [Calocera cornea HHB12733]
MSVLDGDIQHLPMRDALQQHLDRLSELSFALFSSLSALSPTHAHPSSHSLQASHSRPAPEASAFLALDQSFASALRFARVHQLRWERIERLRREVARLEEEMRGVLGVLEEGEEALEGVVEEGEEELGAIKRAKDNPIPYAELMAYASHLSAYTSLPPSFPPYRLPQHPGEEGEKPLHLYAPTQEMLRRGRLNAEGVGMSIAGEEGAVGVPQDHPPLPEAGHQEQPIAPTRPARPAAAEVFNDLDLNLDL